MSIVYPWLMNSFVHTAGPASAVMVTVHFLNVSTFVVSLRVPEYGRECIDLYRVTTAVNDTAYAPMELHVTDITQVLYYFIFQGVNLCKGNLTNITAVAVVNSSEGASASLVFDDFSSQLQTLCKYGSMTNSVVV